MFIKPEAGSCVPGSDPGTRSPLRCAWCGCLDDSRAATLRCTRNTQHQWFPEVPIDATGGRKDDGFTSGTPKRRWRLLPWDALGAVVDVLTWACTRTDPPPYPEHNWRKVEHAEDRYDDALERHLTEWRLHRAGLGGSERDTQSGLHHLSHAACCVIFLLAFQVQRERTELRENKR
jgi:hypothetical protein